MPDTRHLTILKKAAFALVFLVGIVLSMKTVKEPDLWWQLRTGEWMLENGQVTKQDVFSFSYPGVEWVNVKWGYEILQALTSMIGGPAFLPFLQIIITILLLMILFRTTSTLGRNLFRKDYNPGVGAAFIFLLMLWVIEIRMTGRPEAVSHIMAAAYIFLFLQHRFRPSNWIYLAVVLQVLWTNLHEAYGMGIVLAGTFTAAFWMEYLIRNKNWYTGPIIKAPYKITIVTVLAILAIAINPRGFEMILHPLEIYWQLGENKFTIELFSFTTSQYWDHRAFVAIALFISSIVIGFNNISTKNKTTNWWQRGICTLGIGYLLVIIAMIYLSLSAHRNIPFGIIAVVPILAFVTDKWLMQSDKRNRNPIFPYTVIAIGVIFYIAVVSNKYYEVFNPRDRFGLEVNVAKTPYNAANFIEGNKIEGKAFTDFLSSSYLLWHLQPDFKAYIDLRDLDIYPAIFFQNNFMLYQQPWQIFPIADGDMQFDFVVLLNNPDFQKVHQYLLQNPDLELVYGDILASVYLRRTSNNLPVINKYGFNSGQRDVYNILEPFPNKTLPKIATKILNPFYKFSDYTDIDHANFRRAYYEYLGFKLN